VLQQPGGWGLTCLRAMSASFAAGSAMPARPG
jgi:hypothetical protein